MTRCCAWCRCCWEAIQKTMHNWWGNGSESETQTSFTELTASGVNNEPSSSVKSKARPRNRSAHVRSALPVTLPPQLSPLRESYYQRLCNVWAPSFESDMAVREYRGPEMVARFLQHELLVRPDEHILDYLCGVGLVGVQLQSLGFTNVDGVDFSEDMIRFAREKRCYSTCRVIKPGEKLHPAEPYDVVVINLPLHSNSLLATSATNFTSTLEPSMFLVMAQPLPESESEEENTEKIVADFEAYFDKTAPDLKLIRVILVQEFFQGTMGILALFTLATPSTSTLST